jgi:glycosyltransferase involved in cell wall biosynthesis
MRNDSDFVVILDYKGNVSRNAGAIQRHQLYGRTLSSMTNGKTRLLILGNFQGENKANEISDLEFISFPNVSRFKLVFIALSVKTLWNHRQSIKIMVSGDPWMTLVVAKIIRRLLKVRIQLQVQLHGDFFSSAWKELRIRNRIASYFLPTLLKNCESIRVVSSHQAQDLVDSCNIEVNRIVCVPLPLNVPTMPRHNSRYEGMPLAFVGRLEEERGLKNLLNLVKLIPEVFTARTLWISGSGSKRVTLEKELEILLPPTSFVFKEELDAHQLMNMWPRVGILLSLAPAESYGLTMREAIVHGVPVLAVKSVGSILLNQFLKGEGLSMIEEPVNGEKIAQQLSALDKVRISDSTREALFSESANFVEVLCSSWLGTRVK